MKKYVKRVILFLAILVFLLLIMSFAIVQKFATRRHMTFMKRARVEQMRENLIHKYNAKPVCVRTDDGVKLAGLLIVRLQARKTVLILHGYHKSKERMYHYVKQFPRDNMLLFDFRAHGQSDGNTISFGFHEAKDVAAAIDFLRQHEKTKTLPIVGLGVSMGAVALVQYAQQDVLLRGIICDSMFAHFDELVGKKFEQKVALPRSIFLPLIRRLFEYKTGVRMRDVHPIASVRDLKMPILIIHSEEDPLVDVDDARQVYASAQGKKQLWIVGGKCHGRCICKDMPQEYGRRTNAFFDSVL